MLPGVQFSLLIFRPKVNKHKTYITTGPGGASTQFIQTFKKRVFQQKFRPKFA